MKRGILKGNGLEWKGKLSSCDEMGDDIFTFDTALPGEGRNIRLSVFYKMGFTFEPEDEEIRIKRSQLKDFNQWISVTDVDVDWLWSWLKKLSEKK